MSRLNGADVSLYGGSLASTGSGIAGLVTPESVGQHAGSAVHALITTLGFSSLDAVYAFTALLGAMIAVLGFIETRRRTREDKKRKDALQRSAEARDQAIRDWLKASPLHDSSKAPAVVAKISRVLDEVGAVDDAADAQ